MLKGEEEKEEGSKMRRAGFVLLGCVCAVFLTVNMAVAAEKFASVDVMRVASEYNKAKDYNKDLDAKAGTYESEIEKKLNEVKQLQEKMNLMNDKDKDAKKTELENKIKDMQEYRRQKEGDLRKVELENTKDIVDSIKGAIKQHAEKEGYTLVFDDRALVYQIKGMDITDKVIETLNNGYKKR